MKVQRLRFRYRLSSASVGTGHRDLVLAWEAAVKAAGLALSYSEGKRPAAQISLAAPLPQGATSDAEIVDITLECRVVPQTALQLVAPHLPDGVEAISVREVGVNSPSVQSSLRWSEWDVVVPAQDVTERAVREAIDKLLAATTWPAEYKREKKTREYDLRPLVLDIRLSGRIEDSYVLCMRLRAEQDSTARADQVLLALGLPAPTRMHRTRLEVDETSAAIREFRRLREPRAD